MPHNLHQYIAPYGKISKTTITRRAKSQHFQAKTQSTTLKTSADSSSPRCKAKFLKKQEAHGENKSRVQAKSFITVTSNSATINSKVQETEDTSQMQLPFYKNQSIHSIVCKSKKETHMKASRSGASCVRRGMKNYRNSGGGGSRSVQQRRRRQQAREATRRGREFGDFIRGSEA